MTNVELIIQNCKVPSENLIVEVSPLNILTVLGSERTAVRNKVSNLNNYKNIIIITSKQVVAIATIKSVTVFNTGDYSNLWNNPKNSWNSTILFTNVIRLGDSIENIFGVTSKIGNVQTTMFLKTIEESNSLIKAINSLHLCYAKTRKHIEAM